MACCIKSFSKIIIKKFQRTIEIDSVNTLLQITLVTNYCNKLLEHTIATQRRILKFLREIHNEAFKDTI